MFLPLSCRLLEEVGGLEVHDAIGLALVAEKPRGPIPPAVFLATPFAARFLIAPAMAEASTQVIIHFVVGADVDRIFERGTDTLESLLLGRRFLAALPAHREDGGGNRRHEKKIDHVGTTTPRWCDSRVPHGREEERRFGF